MAKQSSVIWDESFGANADLSAKQYYVMKLLAVSAVNTGWGCDVANATDFVLGILQNKPTQYHAGVVRILGYSKAICDGSSTSIAVGDLLGPNASGILVKKNTADYNICAQALEASSAANLIITVKLFGQSIFFRSAAG